LIPWLTDFSVMNSQKFLQSVILGGALLLPFASTVAQVSSKNTLDPVEVTGTRLLSFDDRVFSKP